MRLLSLDSSVSRLSVAIFDDAALVDSVAVDPGAGERQEAATKLVPSIEYLFKNTGWKKESLDFLVVGIGPGSFTGLRIAVVTARSIAQALQLPLLGISRFKVLAEATNESAASFPFSIVLDGGRGNLFLQQFSEESESEPLLSSIESLEDKQDCTYFIEESIKNKIESVLENATINKMVSVENIAELQGRIAMKQLNSCNLEKKLFPYEGVKPLYLRGASITLKKNVPSS